ncbi:DNA binding methylated-DNA--cysteine S-methyltransferase, partial [Athelia psychrophila]
YPTTPLERASFRRPNDKPVTEFQWRVYDYTCRIPKGRVCTYGEVCKALGGGSPRAVGGALRANPFPPTVPCHRVIASTLFIGGFFGKWGIDAAQLTGEEEGGLWKMRVLAEEGVAFDKDGFLADRALVWR